MLFAFDHFANGIAYFGQLFGAGGISLVSNTALYALTSNLPLFAVLVIASMPIGRDLYRKAAARLSSGTLTLLDGVLMAAGFILCIAWLVTSTYNPFLYFRF